MSAILFCMSIATNKSNYKRKSELIDGWIKSFYFLSFDYFVTASHQCKYAIHSDSSNRIKIKTVSGHIRHFNSMVSIHWNFISNQCCTVPFYTDFQSRHTHARRSSLLVESLDSRVAQIHLDETSLSLSHFCKWPWLKRLREKKRILSHLICRWNAKCKHSKLKPEAQVSKKFQEYFLFPFQNASGLNALHYVEKNVLVNYKINSFN